MSTDGKVVVGSPSEGEVRGDPWRVPGMHTVKYGDKVYNLPQLPVSDEAYAEIEELWLRAMRASLNGNNYQRVQQMVSCYCACDTAAPGMWPGGRPNGPEEHKGAGDAFWLTATNTVQVSLRIQAINRALVGMPVR